MRDGKNIPVHQSDEMKEKSHAPSVLHQGAGPAAPHCLPASSYTGHGCDGDGAVCAAAGHSNGDDHCRTHHDRTTGQANGHIPRRSIGDAGR